MHGLWQFKVVVVGIKHRSDADLAEILVAVGSMAPLHHSFRKRHDECRENKDDEDGDEQLNQAKAAVRQRMVLQWNLIGFELDRSRGLHAHPNTG